MSEESKKNIELKEEDLEAPSGGWTTNKYDPNRCKGLTKRLEMCRAVFLEGNCDHFNEEQVGWNANGGPRYNMSCNLGAFPPYKT